MISCGRSEPNLGFVSSFVCVLERVLLRSQRGGLNCLCISYVHAYTRILDYRYLHQIIRITYVRREVNLLQLNVTREIHISLFLRVDFSQSLIFL